MSLKTCLSGTKRLGESGNLLRLPSLTLLFLGAVVLLANDDVFAHVVELELERVHNLNVPARLLPDQSSNH